MLAVVAIASTVMLNGCCQQEHKSAMIEFPAPARPAGQQDVLELRCDPIDTVRIAVIGLGMRGSGAVERLTHVDGAKIVALCDIVPGNVAKAQATLNKAGFPKAAEFSGDTSVWKQACELNNVDLVYICTDWKMHTPIAVYAMEQGKHAVSEVPAALTLDECWQLVNTSEKTRKHFMMLENCCYDFFELATLNMAQQGLFGEVVHTEGAYNHDLRGLCMNDSTGYHDMWRLEYNAAHDGNPYPTHGLGPIAQIMNIHRGDKMDYLVSMSSDQFGLTDAAITNHGPESKFAKRDYKLGDVNTTVIRTAKGKTIMVQHDVSNPRPYSRIHQVVGTRGFAQKYPIEQIGLDSVEAEGLDAKALADLLTRYEHPISKEYGEKARAVGGHGGMDFIMDSRLIYCLRNGLPLDQDVYDAAEWSSLVALTEASVQNGSAPVKVPDFTRGAWDKVKGFSFAYAPGDAK